VTAYLSTEGSRKLIRIVVVDDYAAWRDYARSALEKEPRFQIVAAASDGLQAVQRAQELQSDLVIMDVGLPNLNGIEAARRILQLVPQTKVLFLSDHSSPDIVQEALNTGANGYVLKSCAESELLAAAKAVLAGQIFISQVLADRLAPTRAFSHD
jgi:DNA-binding NarL/FixJ family response regulator